MPASYAMFNSVNKMEVYNYKAEKKAGKSKGDYIHGIVVILAEIDAFVHRDEQEQYVDSVEPHIGEKRLHIPGIGHVAPALSRYEQLLSELFVLLDQTDPAALLRCGQRCHHACGPAAYHDHLSQCSALLCPMPETSTAVPKSKPVKASTRAETSRLLPSD